LGFRKEKYIISNSYERKREIPAKGQVRNKGFSEKGTWKRISSGEKPRREILKRLRGIGISREEMGFSSEKEK